MILNMISNPTRRRILESLTKEPSYPLQLSKEIGVSQQAIMKNLDLLERNGMVIGHQVSMNGIYPCRTSNFICRFDVVSREHYCFNT